MRNVLLILALVAISCGRNDAPIPDHAVELRVARCPGPLGQDPEDFVQPLRADSWRLYASYELEGVMGGINGDIAYARPFSDTAWAILVFDFERTVCEAFVSAEDVELLPIEEEN